MIHSRGKIKKELVSETFTSLTSGKKGTLTFLAEQPVACASAFHIPEGALRESGSMASHKQSHRCAMYQWSW